MLIEETKGFVDEYWFENLNLRGDDSYWNELENDFIKYCEENDIHYVNAFYHSKLVKDKKQGMSKYDINNF